MLASRAYERLAADTLLTALAHYFAYHSKEGEQLRSAMAQAQRNRWGRVAPKEWQRLGVAELRRRRPMLVEIVSQPDPVEFLVSDSVYHAVCDVEPETLRALLSDPKRGRALEAVLKKRAPRAQREPLQV